MLIFLAVLFIGFFVDIPTSLAPVEYKNNNFYITNFLDNGTSYNLTENEYLEVNTSGGTENYVEGSYLSKIYEYENPQKLKEIKYDTKNIFNTIENNIGVNVTIQLSKDSFHNIHARKKYVLKEGTNTINDLNISDKYNSFRLLINERSEEPENITLKSPGLDYINISMKEPRKSYSIDIKHIIIFIVLLISLLSFLSKIMEG